MVKDHSDSERGNPLPPHGLLFPISSKDSFLCTSITHAMDFVTPELVGTINISMDPPWRIDPTPHRTMSECSTTGLHPAHQEHPNKLWRTSWNVKYLNGSTMKDRPDAPPHHERTLWPLAYILLPHGTETTSLWSDNEQTVPHPW